MQRLFTFLVTHTKTNKSKKVTVIAENVIEATNTVWSSYSSYWYDVNQIPNS